MKRGVTCLLVICSLSASGDDTKTAPEVGPNPPPALNAPAKLDGKLDWNVEPVHWEGLLGRKIPATAEAPPSVEPAILPKPASDYDLTHSAGDKASAADEARVERILRKAAPRDGQRIGESDYVFTSPILEGLLPRRLPEDASLGEKILGLPVVRMFRPLPMPEPPGGGKYFKWGSRDRAWVEFNQPLPGPGRIDNGM